MRFLNEKLYKAYHGTKSDFNEFMYQFIGSHGLEHGYGFYFTNREDIAQSYGNIIIQADIEINNPLSNDSITITKNQIKDYIKGYIDPVGDEYLSNFGWYKDDGYLNVLDTATNSVYLYNNNDVDIISDILNSAKLDGLKLKQAIEGINIVFNKDGIIYQGYDDYQGEPVENYIIFNNNQIINKTKIRKD